MEPLPSVLFRLFFEAMIFGGVMDAAFVIVRALRASLFPSEETTGKRRKTAEALCIAAEDMLFCCFTAVGLLLLAFSGTNGRIRWVLPAGVFLGILLSRQTVGALLRRLSHRLTAFLRSVRRLIARIVASPVRWSARLLQRILRAVFGLLRRSVFRRTTRNE